MRLATAYINLSESGYVHRLHWNKQFHCSKDQLEGESIAIELAAESKSMENCYSNWKKKVSDARKEYRELNFFTTQQLILLRKEIATACHSKDLLVSNLQVLTLLESVRPNLDTDQLKSAIERAFRETELFDKEKGTADDLPSFSQVPSVAECGTRSSAFDNNNFISTSPPTVVSTSPIMKPKPTVTSKIQKFLNAAADDGYWCSEEAHEADIEVLYEKARQNPITERAVFSAGELDETQTEDER